MGPWVRWRGGAAKPLLLGGGGWEGVGWHRPGGGKGGGWGRVAAGWTRWSGVRVWPVWGWTVGVSGLGDDDDEDDDNDETDDDKETISNGSMQDSVALKVEPSLLCFL